MRGEEFVIRDMRFKEEQRLKAVTVRDDAFIILALFPKDYSEIARAEAFRRNGLPANAFDSQNIYRTRRDCTISHAVSEGPDWWKGVDKCPEDELLDDLYNEIMSWTEEFQESLKKNKLNKGKPEANIPG